MCVPALFITELQFPLCLLVVDSAVRRPILSVIRYDHGAPATRLPNDGYFGDTRTLGNEDLVLPEGKDTGVIIIQNRYRGDHWFNQTGSLCGIDPRLAQV